LWQHPEQDKKQIQRQWADQMMLNHKHNMIRVLLSGTGVGFHDPVFPKYNAHCPQLTACIGGVLVEKTTRIQIALKLSVSYSVLYSFLACFSQVFFDEKIILKCPSFSSFWWTSRFPQFFCMPTDPK